jgi:hypothetical protein
MKMNAYTPSVSVTMASRVQTFLALINDRLLQGKQMDQLTALWEEAHYYPKCQTVVLKGERQGQMCGKACIKDKDTCMCHSPRPPKKEKPVVHRERCSTMGKKGQCKRFVVNDGLCDAHQPKETVNCSMELKSGERKGTLCGKKCSQGKTMCPSHSPKDTAPVDTPEVVTVKQEKLTKGKK